VAEWQTRTVQVRVSVRTWGFKSPLAHHSPRPWSLAVATATRRRHDRGHIAALAPVVAVSPHLDDVVLSCAGLLAGAPGTTVITVFAGFPAQYDAVTEWDTNCGFGAGDDVVAIRRAEDRAALTSLDATPIWLDFLDEQYATHPVSSAQIADRLRAELAARTVRTVAFPLGLNHPDHQQTHEACVWLLDETPGLAANWVAFTDVPYRAAHSDQVAARLAQLRARGYHLEKFSPDVGAAKVAALAEYRSQLLGLGRDLPDADLPEECYLLRRQ
jgi:LmbE family N-acetylglucosaminyl deacetylase